jgi:hypothetical protein
MLKIQKPQGMFVLRIHKFDGVRVYLKYTKKICLGWFSFSYIPKDFDLAEQIFKTIAPEKYKVNIWEYERGWGSKIDEVKEFDDLEYAINFVIGFNSCNNKEIVPDWYMVAKPVNFEVPKDKTLLIPR